MPLFRRGLWTPSSSIPNAADSQCPEHTGERGEKEDSPATEGSKIRLRKKSNGDSPTDEMENRERTKTDKKKGDGEEFFEVTLTSNAIRCMVHGAVRTSSVYNGDAITNEVGEGIILSTRPTVDGPFVLRLSNLQRQKNPSHGKADCDDDNSANEKFRKKEPTMFTALITDGTKSCLGTIVQTKEDQLENLSECIITVSGFVMGVSSSSKSDDTISSVATVRNDNRSNESGDESDENTQKEACNILKRVVKYSPFIFITRYELLYEKRRMDELKKSIQHDEKLPATDEFHSDKCTYQKRGRLANLMSSTKLQMGDFINANKDTIASKQSHSHDPETTIAKAGKIVEDSIEVSNFIEQHSAIMALKKRKENASLLSSSSFSLMLGSLKYFQNYTSAIKEFDQMQREEQFTSLSDMVEEYCADDFVSGEENSSNKSTYQEEQSLKQNMETLEYALQCQDETLSSELLLRWHAWLLGDGLEQEAGSFRSENVAKRVGELCDALENRWLPLIREDPTNPIHILSFAAAAVLGLLDIAPFQVGNQRLARIVLNWTLRRAGLPFCITLYSNKEEKAAYISAIRLTRQNLCLVPQGNVDEYETMMVLRSTGGLVPLVSYLLNRLARATADLCMLVEKKSCIASEETDARLVRLAREKAAEGSCIICFENNPNIATLCCGKAIHFNCMAEWLKSNSSCPHCRSDLPALSVTQESHQRIDDRRVEYGRERISARGFSNEEFLFESSSSSSSDDSPSSSSSSSSSESSAFFYSGLDYGVNDIQSVSSTEDNESTHSIASLLPTRSDTPTPFQNQPRSYYVTSDDEEEHVSDSIANDDASSTHTYRSDTDDDIDRYSFDTNDSQSLTYDSSNFELARNDDLDVVSDPPGYSQTNEATYQTLNGDSSAGSESSSYQGNEIPLRGRSIQPPSIDIDFAPFRMSFLDPELLGNVQNQNRRWRNAPGNVFYGRYRNGENSQGNDGDIVEAPEFARPEYLRATDDVHPSSSVANSCEFPSQRGAFASPFSRRSRWS